MIFISDGESSRNVLTCVIVALLSMTSGLAGSQTSVTLFGTMDTGIEYISNANKTSRSSVQAGAAEIYSNSFGLRGAEDLGGGIKAIFRLEGGFNPYNGSSIQGGRLFGRQAWVGLQNGNNKVLLGRTYTPLYAPRYT